MDLSKELDNAVQGDPWHGKSSLEIVESCDPEKVFVHWIPDAHSIAEIVMHLTAWTEEAVERMQGEEAKVPRRGDWPVVSQTDVFGWERIVEDFKFAHQRMMDFIMNFSSDDWELNVIDTREDEKEPGGSYSALVNGIIQHLAYHSGQIALLQKF